MKCIDFDRQFEAYMRAWIEKNGEKQKNKHIQKLKRIQKKQKRKRSRHRILQCMI